MSPSEQSTSCMDSTARRRTAELLIATDGLFAAESYRLATLALPYAIPTVSSILEFAAAGDLPSYGISVIDGFSVCIPVELSGREAI
jgi:hypothetical protein